MTPHPVLHVIDTLAAAGAERVAVNIANHLPPDRYVSYFCTTREEGPLEASLATDVRRLKLRRASRLDFRVVKTLRAFIQTHNIRLLHAHSSSLFIVRLATLGLDVSVIWHAHYGGYSSSTKFVFPYRLATNGIAGVMTVSEELSQWCTESLKVPAGRVWYLPNPVSMDWAGPAVPVSLPGRKGKRLICLANFRREKDHFTLLNAMVSVVRNVPQAHLLLAGKCNDGPYKSAVQHEISRLGLQSNVTILGERHDVSALLRASDIGVLSSTYEGLPMALLEYGAAGLPVVATDVGQCSDVLQHGEAGLVVPPSSPEALAGSLLTLLDSEDKRRKLGCLFRERVRKTYSTESVMDQVCVIYDTVRGSPRSNSAKAMVGCNVPTGTVS